MSILKKTLKNSLFFLAITCSCILYSYWYVPDQYFFLQHPNLAPYIFAFSLIYNHITQPLFYFSTSVFIGYILKSVLSINISAIVRKVAIICSLIFMLLYLATLLISIYHHKTINYLVFFPELKFLIIVFGCIFAIGLRIGDE